MQKQQPKSKQQPFPPPVQSPVKDQGFASADEPAWAPPETRPEPIPVEPILDQDPNSPPPN